MNYRGWAAMTAFAGAAMVGIFAKAPDAFVLAVVLVFAGCTVLP